MLITLFLVLINIFNIVTSNSPNVEGMTAIAAWMLVCIFFVFGALGREHLVDNYVIYLRVFFFWGGGGSKIGNFFYKNIFFLFFEQFWLFIDKTEIKDSVKIE